MKLPEFGFNKERSFIEFETTEGKAIFGKENNQLYLEINGVRTYLMETDGRVFNTTSINNVFTGPVDLTRALTHYAELTLVENLEFIDTGNAIVGGYAEVTLIGDGSHSPTFDSDFIATPGSTAYDTTLGVRNIFGIYFNGYRNFYTNTVIS